jgi:hypothetical protein
LLLLITVISKKTNKDIPMRLKKLNARGFSHDIMIVAVVVVFAVCGVGYMVASHADDCTPVSGAVTAPVTTTTNCTPASSPVSSPSVALVPLYESYNSKIGDHFYTDSATEKNNVAYYGYQYQGIQGYVYPTQVSGSVPLYELYSSTVTDHFYTDSASQKNSVVAYYGYKYETIEGYVMPTQVSGTVPLYQLWNAKIGDHFYTDSATQKSAAVADYGYTYETIQGYVYPTGN